ncbi:MAG: inositol monophosphatase [Desulfobacterales bacterium]|nr:inositol monophosphatase [Desulfobacterales bacterium]
MISFLIQIITRAGEICLKEQESLTREDLEFKSPKDIVTTIDKKVEDYIVQAIGEAYPDHGIFGEETGQSQRDSEYCWIIDPIDGTTSFVHGQPFYCVSIALEKNNCPLMAAVNAPLLGQLFHAEQGKGAFLNNRPIRVSHRTRLMESVMATGFACLRSDLKENNLPHFNRIVPQLRDIRRFGSAAMDLCYVACGKVDGFWEMNLNPYDVAAGALIVQEAGGRVTDFNNGKDYPEKGIIAANETLHPLLARELNPGS